MATEGPNSPSAAVSASGSGGSQAWSSPTNCFSSNGSDASATSLNNTPDGSEYLKATGFGFSIPSGATIDGITVEIEQDEGRNGTCFELSIKIVRSDVISGDEKSTGANLPNSDAYVTYGGASDLWGLTWTDSIINASDFGIAYSAYSDDAEDVFVDHMRITVDYTEAAAGGGAHRLTLLGCGT